MRPVRVAQVVMDIRPYRVGFYERIAQDARIHFTVYAGRPASGQGAPETQPQVAVPVVPVTNRYWPHDRVKVWWVSGALRALRSDADVIVVQEIVSNLTVWAIRFLHRPFGKRLALHGFFYRPQGLGRLEPVRSALRRLLRSSASALVAYTELGRRELTSDGVDPDKVFVNGNTLDTDRLMMLAQAVSTEESNEVRGRLGVHPDTRVLVFLGRLRRLKRVEVLIEAMGILTDRMPDPPVLLVIGDGERRVGLEEAAAGLPVHFLGQIYDESELARLLSVASLLVLPAWVGLTCVHGFANGLPCLTASAEVVAQTPEFAYIVDGENGVVVDECTAERFAEAVEELLSDPRRMAALSEGALASARSLSMDRMVESFVQAMLMAGSAPTA